MLKPWSMPAFGVPINYHPRVGRPILGLHNSPRAEAAAMLELLEHGYTVAEVRELIIFPPKAQRELLAGGAAPSLIRKSAEFRERVLDLFENMHEKRKKKARRALRKVQFGFDADVAHVATMERFCSQSSTA